MNISQSNTKKRPTHKEITFTTLEFPFGVQAHFQFQTDQFILLEIKETLKHILTFDPKEILDRSIFFLINFLCIKHIIQSTHALLQKGMEYIKYTQTKKLCMNLEFYIKEENTGSKRTSLQLPSDSTFPTKIFREIGKSTDTSHFIKTGAPVLTIIKENNILKRITYVLEVITNSNGYNLSAHELEFLKLKSDGYNTKKIPETRYLTTLSICSIIRYIKSKTGIAPVALIKKLSTQGKT